MFASGAALAGPDYPGASPTPPASAPAAADAGPDWNSMPQDGLFSSITQNLRESEQEVVRGHFDLGEPPNVRRYYCLVNPKNGRREPNGVAGTPVQRKENNVRGPNIGGARCERHRTSAYLLHGHRGRRLRRYPAGQ